MFRCLISIFTTLGQEIWQSGMAAGLVGGDGRQLLMMMGSDQGKT